MASSHTGEDHRFEVSSYFVEKCMPRKVFDMKAGIDTGGPTIDIPFCTSDAVSVMKVIIYSVEEHPTHGRKPYRLLGTFCANMDAEIPFYWGSPTKWFWLGKILHHFHHEFDLDMRTLIEHDDLAYWEQCMTSNKRYRLHVNWWLFGPAARYLGMIGLEGEIAGAVAAWGDYLEPGKADNWVIEEGTFGRLGWREVCRSDWPNPDDPEIMGFLTDIWPYGKWE